MDIEAQQYWIIAGLTTGKRPVYNQGWVPWLLGWLVHFWWLLAQLIVGYGKFTHVYLGFEEHGRELIYHSTKNRAHLMLRRSFLLQRVVYAEWAIPVDREVFLAFVDSCYADSGLLPYGHLQNITTGLIKLWNHFVQLLRLKFLVIYRNPFGSGARRQNCSERAGRKLADFVVGGGFLKKNADLYAPDDFHDECLAYELVNPEVRRLT